MTDKTDKGGTVSGHVRNVSATERLSALLTERGVEWRGGLPSETIVSEPIDALCVERPDGRMHVYFRSYLTPEQAVAATLGAGTCHIDLVGYTEREDRYQCRSCGWSMSVRRGTWPRLGYCPNCGRKVVE